MAHRTRSAMAVGFAVALGALGNYELVAKGPHLLGGRLPGWREARLAERSVHYRAVTGIPPLDRLWHEGEEATVFYAALARW